MIVAPDHLCVPAAATVHGGYVQPYVSNFTLYDFVGSSVSTIGGIGYPMFLFYSERLNFQVNKNPWPGATNRE